MDPNNSLHGLGKALLILGLVVALAGLVLTFWDRLPLSKIPLGRLPGDISIERKDFRLYFPLGTSLVLSLVISLILWLFRR